MLAIKALKSFCDLYYGSNNKVDWILVGSVASLLQGAEMDPNDIDIYTKDQDDVLRLSTILAKHSKENPSDLPMHDPKWMSSIAEPFFTQSFPSGFTWTKGKWEIDSFQLEVVQISNSAGIPDSISGDGIWEGGKYIWEYFKEVEFANYRIPVVPLEIQLESNLRRNREDRAKSIISAMKKHGFDRELLEKSLSIKHKKIINDLL
ncbi:hypothetical protein ACFQ3W_10155 [Paenibacillus puldeungensis]|uniref:Aminoglycoside-2''-adenylyltransferase n=1 Tax=Paenibacillus puldeungensis TaxID=696536 RepID=A0ABW3RW26_9BACL